MFILQGKEKELVRSIIYNDEIRIQDTHLSTLIETVFNFNH